MSNENPTGGAAQPFNVVTRMNELLPVIGPRLALLPEHLEPFSAALEEAQSDDSRPLVAEQQDAAMAKRIRAASRIPMPPGVDPLSFGATPVEIMGYKKTDADGNKEQRFVLLENNGTGWVGITNADPDSQVAILTSITQPIGLSCLQDGTDTPLVAISLSGKDGQNSTTNKMIHEKIATAALVAKDLEEKLGGRRVHTYMLSALQDGTQTFIPGEPAVVLGFTHKFYDPSTISVVDAPDEHDPNHANHGVMSLNFLGASHRITHIHNDRLPKNLSKNNPIVPGVTRFVNEMWASGQDKGLAYEQANALNAVVGEHFPLLGDLITYRVIEETHPPVEGESNAEKAAREALNFEPVIDEAMNLLAQSKDVIFKPSGTGVGHGIVIVKRRDPAVPDGEPDPKIIIIEPDDREADVRQKLRQGIQISWKEVVDNYTTEQVVDTALPRKVLTPGWPITDRMFGSNAASPRKVLTAGWPITVAEAYDPDKINAPEPDNPYRPLHEHTFESRIGVMAVREPGQSGQPDKWFLEALPVSAKVNPKRGSGLNNTTTALNTVSKAGEPPTVIKGVDITVPLNNPLGMQVLGLTEEDLVQMSQWATRNIAENLLHHTPRQTLTSEQRAPLLNALRVSQAQQATESREKMLLAMRVQRLEIEYGLTRRFDPKKGKGYELGKLASRVGYESKPLEVSTTTIADPSTLEVPANTKANLSAASLELIGNKPVVMVPDGKYKVPSTRATDLLNRVVGVDAPTQDILINFTDPKDHVDKVMRLTAVRLAEGQATHGRTPANIATQLADGGVHGFTVPAKKDPQELAKEQALDAQGRRTGPPSRIA